ncbi:hypothetical protein CYMTET_56965 [Cymbomonas tetramitiformis]|uniref:Uncharacterized protein n=1 Tax=Cymbomonas tetramitiformis TaxID=36881 RepID=A0AAE0BB28_9CHLO|nr:hypothetical protein CYMTET_56965 [Cymbomonas tetramitiformis]
MAQQPNPTTPLAAGLGTPVHTTAPQQNPATPMAAAATGVPQHATGQYASASFAAYNAYSTPVQSAPTAGGLQYTLPISQPAMPQQNAAGFQSNNGPPINPLTGQPYVSRYKRDFEEEKQRTVALETRLQEMQTSMGEMHNNLIQAQAETAEALREATFEKRVAEARFNVTKTDNDLRKMGGALAGAAATAGNERGGKSVHFETIVDSSDDGEKKKKKRSRKGRDKKRKKSRRDDSTSDSSTSTSGGSSDGSKQRREKQRRKRTKGADLVHTARSLSGSAGGQAGPVKGLGSSGTSPDPKGTAFRAMMAARDEAYA